MIYITVLAATILHMMSRLGQYTRYVHERLELAYLNFMQQFRKIYIGKMFYEISFLGDSTHRASKVYKRLSDMLQMNDQNEVLEAIIKKMYVLRKKSNSVVKVISDIVISKTR